MVNFDPETDRDHRRRAWSRPRAARRVDSSRAAPRPWHRRRAVGVAPRPTSCGLHRDLQRARRQAVRDPGVRHPRPQLGDVPQRRAGGVPGLRRGDARQQHHAAGRHLRLARRRAQRDRGRTASCARGATSSAGIRSTPAISRTCRSRPGGCSTRPGSPGRRSSRRTTLDEVVISSLLQQGARIDSYGVGTRLVTGYDQPCARAGSTSSAARRDEHGAWRDAIKPVGAADPLPAGALVRPLRASGAGGKRRDGVRGRARSPRATACRPRRGRRSRSRSPRSGAGPRALRSRAERAGSASAACRRARSRARRRRRRRRLGGDRGKGSRASRSRTVLGAELERARRAGHAHPRRRQLAEPRCSAPRRRTACPCRRGDLAPLRRVRRLARARRDALVARPPRSPRAAPRPARRRSRPGADVALEHAAESRSLADALAAALELHGFGPRRVPRAHAARAAWRAGAGRDGRVRDAHVFPTTSRA